MTSTYHRAGCSALPGRGFCRPNRHSSSSAAPLPNDTVKRDDPADLPRAEALLDDLGLGSLTENGAR